MIRNYIFAFVFLITPLIAQSSESEDWGGLEVNVFEVDLTLVPKGVFDFAGEDYLKANEKAVVVSAISPNQALKNGLIGKLVLGVLDPNSRKISERTFIQNREFRLLVQQLAAIGDEPGLKKYISTQNPEFVAAIDQRTANPMGNVPNEDIIGFYIIKNGKIDSFNQNKNYKLVTKDGVAKFTPGVVKQLQELINRASEI